MSATVVLLRHPPVARAWAGRCYGRSDMRWSRAGSAMARTLADTFAAMSIDAIVHSGATRTRRLAETIAARTRCPVATDPRWLERDFGSWEARSWTAIWRETGDLMDRMTTHPDTFRPGGGETGRDLSLRARAAWDALPTTGTTLVVAHGGPIAAIRCWRDGAPLSRMIDYVPACGEAVVSSR